MRLDWVLFTLGVVVVAVLYGQLVVGSLP